MLICQSGGRSMLAAEVLQRLGYRNVVSVRGGTLRWTADGFPLTRPETDVEIDHDFHDRYSRHLLLPEIGMRGQRRLELARVLMIGAGGLGSPAAFRSEEHTSEHQSLMRNSSAVLCLQKKLTITQLYNES